MCRSRRELSSAYFLAKFGFDTAENERLTRTVSLARLTRLTRVRQFDENPVELRVRRNLAVHGELVLVVVLPHALLGLRALRGLPAYVRSIFAFN